MNLEKLKKKHGEVIDLIESFEFYTRYEAGIPIYTACLLFGENGTVLSRGISVCSLLEEFSSKEGKNRALGRAIKAVANTGSSEPINAIVRPITNCLYGLQKENFYDEERILGEEKFNSFIPIIIASSKFTHKSEYAPMLNSDEMLLLNIEE
ncbi:MAG TPA: hypothetical protein DGG95_11940 [Cytophagales bacterium]|jgi:hypothetical protein|nr:hypothetical protein [Cytophagales bacterium]